MKFYIQILVTFLLFATYNSKVQILENENYDELVLKSDDVWLVYSYGSMDTSFSK
jgi:hypothetical protein